MCEHCCLELGDGSDDVEVGRQRGRSIRRIVGDVVGIVGNDVAVALLTAVVARLICDRRRACAETIGRARTDCCSLRLQFLPQNRDQSLQSESMQHIQCNWLFTGVVTTVLITRGVFFYRKTQGFTWKTKFWQIWGLKNLNFDNGLTFEH